MHRDDLVPVGGDFLHVVVSGTTGPIVVLCNGLGGIWTDWDDTSELLAADHLVVRFDRPGVGLSPPATSAADPSVRGEAVRIALVLDALAVSSPVTVVGHSLAGFYAEAFARLFPDRTGGLLLLESSVAQDVRPLLPRRARVAAARVLTRVIVAAGADRLVVTVLRRAISPNRDPRTATPGVYLGAVLRENAVYADLAAELRELRRSAPLPPVPILVAAAVRRRRRPWARRWVLHQRELARRLGGSAVTVENAHHQVMIDKPDEVAELVRDVTHRSGCATRPEQTQ